MTPAPRVLVFGASGYVGTHLVPRLQAAGVPVRAAARSRRVLEARNWPGVEIAEADALVPASLPGALQDIDTAYYLVHSMAAGRDFGRLDLEAARNFAAAAAAAGVRRIVYLGGLVPAGADSEHIVSRRDTGDALRGGPVPVTEIRAGIIVGPGSAAFEVMRDLVLHLPAMITPRWVRAKSPPLALDNLLEYLVRIRDLPETAGRIYEAGGPEVLDYQTMMRELAELAGRRAPWILPVPVLSPRLSSYWLRFVTSVPTSVARALIEGLRHDFTADDGELRRLVPQRLLTFRESVQAVFEAERNHAVEAHWTEGAFPMRDYRLEHAFYAMRASGSATTNASPAEVWPVVTAIGGENRYYALDWLWTVRGWIDWLVGGTGHRRERRHPVELRVGDRIDSWRVVGVEPTRRLTLKFGMKAPGAGALEFGLEPLPGGGTRVTTTAYWHPAGVWGLAYWHALHPAHIIIFDRLSRAICRRAERAVAGSREQSQ